MINVARKPRNPYVIKYYWLTPHPSELSDVDPRHIVCCFSSLAPTHKCFFSPLVVGQFRTYNNKVSGWIASEGPSAWLITTVGFQLLPILFDCYITTFDLGKSGCADSHANERFFSLLLRCTVRSYRPSAGHRYFSCKWAVSERYVW